MLKFKLIQHKLERKGFQEIKKNKNYLEELNFHY